MEPSSGDGGVESDGSNSYEPEYEIETVTVGDSLELSVLTLLPPPIEYMSALHSQQREISGRQVWTGSFLLASLFCLDEYKGIFDNRRVLELGSGTGESPSRQSMIMHCEAIVDRGSEATNLTLYSSLTGLLGMTIARLADSCQVVLTDGDPLAIDLLRQNVSNADNQLDPDMIQVKHLLWSKTVDQSHEFCRWCRNAWKWRSERVLAFDAIVAGDVLYKDELPSIFFGTVRSLLATNGVLYLCHVPRANVDHEVVLQTATAAGFTCDRVWDAETFALIAGGGGSADDMKRAEVYRMTLAN